MPFSEFQNGNAGLALPTFQLQSQDAFASLMERAQRMKISQEDFKLKQESHAANLVTSALQQDQYRADISIKRPSEKPSVALENWQTFVQPTLSLRRPSTNR